jgi:hypothetical protein
MMSANPPPGARSFDEFPLKDPIAKKDGRLSDLWVGSLSSFYQTLIYYITAFGITPPNLTTAQRNTITAPQNGQMIYNTTIDAPQFYQVSSKSWRTMTFT